MDLRAFRYFVETARLRSFTLAAEQLCVTQSTVSKMVRQLEDELGQALLIREGRSVRLTDAGRLVHERAQEALAVVQRLKRDVADLSELASGELAIGIPPMVNLFFPDLIQAFKAAHPHLGLSIIEAGGQVIEQQVLQGDLELGVTLLPSRKDKRFASMQLGRYPVCLVGPSSAPWARQKRPSLALLHQQAVVMPHEDYALTHLLEAAFDAAGIRPRLVARSGQWDFLLSMALAGTGTALLPEPLLQRLQLSGDVAVRALPLKEVAWCVGQIWVPGRYLSHAARAWLDVSAHHLQASGDRVSGML